MPERTDHNEALRLADELVAPIGTQTSYQTAHEAAALLRQQAERIAELEKEIANLHTTMFAAAVEIQEQWDAHCDAEGYGPANLMHRLERGIASQYGYDAKTLQRIEADRDQLRAEVERLRVDAERYRWLADGDNFYEAICLMANPKLTAHALGEAIDHARTTHKDEG